MVNYHKLPVFSVNMYSKSDLVPCGKLGSKFGKLGGRPITKGQLGMPDSKYNEIMEAITSHQLGSSVLFF